MMTFEATPAGLGEGSPAAHLTRLSLTNYRNFQGLECAFPAAGVALIGPNGSGKTNLLEAIYYLEIFRSFRGSRDSELIRFGADVFRVEATVRDGDEGRTLAAAYRRSPGRKKVEVDGREVDRLSDAIGTLGAAVFRLDDVEVVRGSPGERRRFLDILLSLTVPGYLSALQRYRSVLSQRNEALRDGAPSSLVDAFTEGLLKPAAAVMEARARWVAERADAFARYHGAISGGTGATVAYEPSAGSAADVADAAPGEAHGREEWTARLRRALAETAEQERRRGVTVVGPQRDDLGFRADVAKGPERSLRAYGSSGQQRTAALALRLVEADTLRDRLGREPLYLLDDVFAELDEARSRRLLALLDEGRSGQVILTAPKPGEVSLRSGGLVRWRIRNGRILSA